MSIIEIKEKFKLTEQFIEEFTGKQPKWGPLGYITYKRTYARELGDGSTEEFWQTIQRVVEGCYTIQLNHCKGLNLPWKARKAQKSAQKMYRLMWEFKFLPPGRGLWSMGAKYVYERGSMALVNCAFLSTKDLKYSFSEPFVFLMDASLVGVGVGFDTKGAGEVRFTKPVVGDETFVVEDSKEGWCSIVEHVLDSYVGKTKYPKEIDYSLIRPAGSEIKTFGGIAPGPQPLIDCINTLNEVLEGTDGTDITSVQIVDLMNIIGKCVVSGGVRRCLPKGTNVHTDKGILPIEDVKVGMKVRTSEGLKPVVDWVAQGDQELVEVETQIGSFKCTPNHRVKVYTGLDTFSWVEASKLKEDNRLVFLNSFDETGIDPTDSGSVITSKNETRIKYLSELFDNYSSKNNPSIVFSYKELPDVKEAKEIYASLGIPTYIKFINGLHNLILLNSKAEKLFEMRVAPHTYTYSCDKVKEDVVSNLTPVKVVAVNPVLGQESTYDISVEGNHEFAIGNGLLVHNTAELALGEGDDKDYCEMKDIDIAGDKLNKYRWASNNSIFAHVGDDYSKHIAPIQKSGDPGMCWLDNAQHYGRMKDGYGDHDELVLGVNPCFHPENNLITLSKEGVECLTTVKEIKEGDLIWSESGWTKVIKKQSRGIKPVYEYTTRVGKIALTDNHKIIQNGNKVEINEAHSIDILRGVKTNTVDFDVDYVMAGLILGEGWIKKSREYSYKLLCIGEHDQDYFDSEVGSKILNCIGDYSYTVEDSLLEYHHVGDIVTRSIPAILMEKISANGASSLLRGLFSANGSALVKANRLVYKTSSSGMRDNIQTLLSFIGVKSYYTVNKPTIINHHNGEYTSKENYQICISSSDIKTFHEKVGFIQKYKTDNLSTMLDKPINTNSTKDSFEILSTDFISEEEVFDITVDNKTHTLWCNGFNVSNCGEMSLETYEMCVSGDTRIHTKNNFLPIQELVGKEVSIFNGEEWSKVTPRQTGTNRKLFRVTMSDGTYLDCTGNHRWLTTPVNGNILNEVETKDLQVGDYTPEFKIEGILGEGELNSHEIGSILGSFYKDLILRDVFSWNKESALEFINGYSDYNNEIISNKKNIINFVHLLKRCGIKSGMGIFDSEKELYILKREGLKPQTIVSVEELSGKHKTYCFDEPLLHQGVFGNVLTKQCNIAETFPSKHDTYEEYRETLKYAYLWAKTVSLIPTHNQHTNSVMMRNRRIGISQSGIIESFEKHGKSEHFKWCDKGYNYIKEIDKKYSGWLSVPRSIKLTTVKPSGTVSLLPGVTAGIHYAHSEYYWRTIRIPKLSPLIDPLKKAGYKMEESVAGDGAMVVYFPVHEENFNKSKEQVTLWEQMENVAQMQYWWADNSVSVTVTFKPEEVGDLNDALQLYETRLKSVSFLPLTDHQYEQAPYQEIDKETYDKAIKQVKKVNLRKINTDEVREKFCDGDNCVIPA